MVYYMQDMTLTWPLLKDGADKTFFLLLGVLLCALPASAQQASLDDLGDETPRLMLALSTADYPATPGDVYNLRYHAGISGNGAAAVSIPLVLDAGYQLKVQNMGTINARNKTYLQVRREVEGLVSRNYPMSGPTLTLVRMGSFSVLVAGETTDAGNRGVDGLTRVSALSSSLTGKASIRFIRVTHANGTTHTYDLFVAVRNGDLAQNPYVAPGDRVVIPAAGRIVQLQGEVYRAGRYELLEDEQLAELIETYGDGFTKEAAQDKLVITRLNPALEGSRDMINLSWQTKDAVTLEDGDLVSVTNKERNRQAVFFEGAVFSVVEDEELQDRDERTHAATRIPYYFYPGETIGQAARNVRAHFSDVSDLSAAYILRDTEQMAVNLERFLYRNETEGDVPLASGDIVVIPYRRFYAITGEVNTAGNRSLDSLARLSSLLTDLTAKASSRLVTVTSETGAAATYDLFQARRFGDLSQDPYIRPRDAIQVLPAGRVVTLTGEVFRPGVYELLPGEALAALVEQYGDGFTLAADPGRMRLTRIDAEGAGETKVFDYKANAGMALRDRDVITVGNKALSRPVVFFEGAIAQGTAAVESTTAEVTGAAKMEYPFYEGETLGNAARASAGRFTASSDLANAYVIRDGRHIGMDLRRYIYHNDFTRDLALANGDIIVIPFRQYFVLVSGAVKLPGRYPYVPDRQADYYVSLAGGRDDMQNNGRGIAITDLNKRKLKEDALIEPETIIWVPINRFTVYFNQYGPVITTILSIVTAVLTVFAITGGL
jgi:protein involved in polysaccharide export with SLBB domain